MAVSVTLPAATGSKADRSSAYKGLSFAEVLEDLSSRFIVNLPADELASIERICFQVEQAHWFYEDFLRPLNPSLPSLGLRRFSSYLLHTSSLTVPLIRRYITGSGAGQQDLEAAFDEFLKYKTRVPVCGAVLLAQGWDKCLLVKGWKASAAWGFPKGKINQDEPERDCAVREVLEETGFDCSSLLPTDSPDFLELTMREQKIRLYIVPGVCESTHFEALTRKEISKIAWFKLSDLPTWKKSKEPPPGMGGRFYLISPFIGRLKQWIHANKRSHPYRPRRAAENGHATEVHATSELDAHPSSHDILGMGGEHGELPSTPERRTYAQPANHYVESPTKTPSAFSTAADGAVPLFPDSSSLFPTFSDDKARAPKASSSSAPSGAQATATTEGLKALLGLGGSSAAHEQAAASVEFPGLGARMIAEQGDERGRQLLDLLRGAGGPASGLSGSTKAQDLQGDERAQGAAPLLAALSAGAGVKESEAPAAAPHAPQEAGALFDLLRGGAPARSPPPHSNSPLPAPRAQNTAQVNNLLALLSPATSSFSISAHESRKEQETPTTSTFSSGPSPSMLGAPPTTSYLQHHPQVKDSAEQERAHKRAALLAALADPGPAPSERSLLGSVPTDQQVLQTPRVGPTRSLVSLEPRTSLSPSQVRAKGMLDMITGQTPLAQRAGSDSEHATPRFEGASAPAPEPAQEPLPAHYFPPNPNPNPQTADEAGAAQLLAMRQGANQPGVKGAMPDPAALLAFLSGAAGAGSTSPSAQPALPATLPAMQSGQDADWVEAQSRERAKAFRFPAPPAGVAPPSVSDQARQQQHPSVHGHSPVPVSASQQSRSPAHLPVNNNAMNGQHAPSDDRSSALLAMLNGSESAGLSPQVQTRQAAPLPGAQQGVPRSSLQPHQQQQQQQQTGDRSSALLAMLNGNGTGGPAGPANGPAHHSPLMMPRAPAGPAGPTGWPRHGGQPPSMPPMFGHSSGDPPPTAWATAGAGFVPPLQGTQHPGMGPMGPMGPVGPMSMPMGMGMGMGMPVGMGVGGPTHPAQHPHQHPHPHMPPHSQPPPLFNQAAPPEAGHGAGHGAGAGRAPIAGLPSTGGGLSALDVLMRGMSTG